MVKAEQCVQETVAKAYAPAHAALAGTYVLQIRILCEATPHDGIHAGRDVTVGRYDLRRLISLRMAASVSAGVSPPQGLRRVHFCCSRQRDISTGGCAATCCAGSGLSGASGLCGRFAASQHLAKKRCKRGGVSEKCQRIEAVSTDAEVEKVTDNGFRAVAEPGEKHRPQLAAGRVASYLFRWPKCKSRFNSLVWDYPTFLTDFNNGLPPPNGPYNPSGYSNGNGPAQGRDSTAPSNMTNAVSATRANWIQQ